MSRKRVYLDYASTTPLDARVRRAMERYLTREYGNPSAVYAEGVAAKKALDSARTKVARFLECRADEVVFTSGGTEANNAAIFGVVNAISKKNIKPHIITTNIEHASVLEPLRALERQRRIEISCVPVEKSGIVRAENIFAAVRPNTALVSVQYANNEIGAIQPIKKIAALLHTLKNRPLFHVDACQAPLYLHCLVHALGVDLLSLDAHKIYGPKGIGCLYIRRTVSITPLLYGGGQEGGMRATTENVSGIVGLAEALHIAAEEREKESVRLASLRDILYSEILENIRITKMVLNGSMERGERLPNNLNLSLPGVDTEMLALRLDAAGVAASTKSSCLRDERESYVVRALGGGARRAASTLRLTLGRATTKKDIHFAARALARTIQAL